MQVMLNADESRYPWLWDVAMDNREFDAILSGRDERPGFDAHWALLRLIEYAPYREIKRLLPLSLFPQLWSDVAPRVRSVTRRTGMDFIALRQRREVHAHG